ncbi:MAG: sulfotransferase domain-containing protein [Planctomycetaceae bacterium]
MLVWLASYPRSGNTFLRIILREVFGVETYSLYRETEETCPVAAGGMDRQETDGPSAGDPYDVARYADRAELDVVKTHHPPFDDRQAIYVIRDGREAISSYFHYLRDIDHKDSDMLAVIAGLVSFGSWGDHVRRWDPLSRPNTLLLRFERLVADPIGHIPLLAEFLDIAPIGDRIPTFEELHQIAPKFFRSGRTDSWRSQFSPNELSLLEALHGDVLAEYGYPFESPGDVRPGSSLRELIRRVDEERQQLHSLAVWQGDELRKHQMILADAATAVRKLEESLTPGRAA